MTVIQTTVKNKKLVEERRKQIILSAMKLFPEKGFHETTLRDLAESAGISHGNIYDYVGTKEDIFFLLHKYMHDVITGRINESIKNIVDPLEKLRRIVRCAFQVMYQWSEAILVIYQESHVLKKPLLKSLLKKERAHMEQYEIALEDCIKKGLFRDFNARAVAHLIKSMVDTWVLKGWDLKGYVTQTEMERCVLDLIVHGLLKESGSRPRLLQDKEALDGKSAMVINAGTILGQAIASFLLSKEVRLAIYHDDGPKGDGGFPVSFPEGSKETRLYSAKDYKLMTADLFKQIENDFQQIDIIIHDLGIGYKGTPTNRRNKILAGQKLEANLRCAQDLAAFFEAERTKRNSGRIVYLAPWAWDKYADPFRYEAVKAGTIALTKNMSNIMAPSKINVNCIIPGFIRAIRPSKIEKEQGAGLMGKIPFGYLGEIPDVLEAVSFLISGTSKYLTGQVLEVSGGIP